MTSVDREKLKQVWTTAGQGHVFRFEEKLSEAEKESFYDQLQGIDVKGLATKYSMASNPST
jgi:hypothetical protein